jgi:glycosyltransferase involved in cell wall biosynthesis
MSGRVAGRIIDSIAGKMKKITDQIDSNPASISVFFPFYNEQDNICRVYESATMVLKNMGSDYQIILVDDGSTDQTPQIADAIAKADPKVTVIHHSTNLGFGAALQSGFRAANKLLIFYSDGDGQFDLNELPPLVPLMNRCDIVSCYRLNRQDPFWRKFNAWCWTTFMCALFGLKLKDINCAFKLYKREIFGRIKMQSTGALIHAEIFARATRQGFAITQTGVHHFPRIAGRQTGAKPKVIFRAFWELLELYKEINEEKDAIS